MSSSPTSGVVAFQSDRVEDLVDRLVFELVQRERDTVDSQARRPFVDHCVVLPTHNLRTYLNFEIAARRGVAAGVDYQTMERFLGEMLPHDNDGIPEVRILDQTAMTRLLLALLDDEEVLGHDGMEPVRRFIRPEPESPTAVVERRKFQLAFRVARLFEEYGYSRRNLLEKWRVGESGLEQEYKQRATAAHYEIERWQMSLWRQLFGPEGRLEDLDDDEQRWMTLPEAVFHHARSDEHELNWPDDVHIFGHSYLPRFFRDLFASRKRVEDHRIALYVMTPSRQHWSHGVAGDRDEDPVFDILTDDSILSGDEYPLALDVWGRAGRDYQRMLDDVTDHRFDVSGGQLRPTHTLLQHFQQVIRNMETASEMFVDAEFPEDEKSVNFWSCASVQRECEAVASEIWEMMATHDDLRFNDIAVVVQPGQRTLYQTHLQAAFEQTGSIPCNVIDVEGTEASPFLEAVELLLHIPLGQFRRSELLAFVSHPCVVANWPEADEEAWVQWCDEVNVFQGADADDLEGTYLDEDRFTWSQGMRRLVLGAFMSQPIGGRTETFRLDGHRYLPHETNHDEQDTVAVLAMLVDELIGHARGVRDEKRPLGEWLQGFIDRISRHLQPRDRAERRTRMECMAALADAAESDACPDEGVSYRVAFEFAMSALSQLEQTRGQYLADGVVVSAFRPMRPIPFEVVFVTGLGEGNFPAPDPPDMLDLRRVKSEPHDVNPRYRDQYMFLETLMSTRSRLYLSWVGRHAVTGDPIEPASAVHQFREMLFAMAPTDGRRATEIRERLEERTEFVEHPLRRWQRRYFPEFEDGAEPEVIDASGADAIPPGPPQQNGERLERVWPNHHREARREARVLAVRRRLDDELPSGYRPTMHELERTLDEGVFAPLVELVDWWRSTSGLQRSDGETLVLQLRSLRQFLKSPLQGSARILLGIWDEDIEDVIDVDHEPFEADFLTRLLLVRRALRSALTAGEGSRKKLEETFDRHAEAAQLAGELPAGIFYDAERHRCIDELVDYADALADEQLVGRRLHRIRFGAARHGETIDDVREPLGFDIELDDRSYRVELHGTVEVIDGDDPATLVIAAGQSVKPKYVVDGALGQLMLQAAGVDTTGEMVVLTKGGELARHRVDVGHAEARDYLQQLTADVLSGVHDYFLPVELAAELAGGDIDDYRRVAARKKEPDYRGNWRVSSVYGPVRRWYDAEPLERERAERVVQRRYSPFIELLAESV